MSFTHLHIPMLAKRFIQEEKKRLNEALPIQKSCLGYAIAECMAFRKLPSNAYSRQLLRI